jgi:hypothetical protein
MGKDIPVEVYKWLVISRDAILPRLLPAASRKFTLRRPRRIWAAGKKSRMDRGAAPGRMIHAVEKMIRS